MELGLRGKHAIVTAASKGIGREIALGLAREGAAVAICARTEAALRRTESDLAALGVRVLASVCDVADPEALDTFLDRAHATFGRIDVLVNNATGYGWGDDESAWRASLDVDIMSAVRACRKVVPWMTAAGGGAIVHVASVAGLEATPNPAYAAGKAAIISHSKSLAISLAPHKVRANVVAPGSIEFAGGLWEKVKQTNRPMYDSVLGRIPSGRLGLPDEVANAVVFLASERASWITGACLVVDGGQHKGNL